MPDSSTNSQVIDSIAAINTLLTGQAPGTAFAMLDLALTQSLATAMQNLVQRQQQTALFASAAVNAACAQITAARGAAAPATPPPVPQTPDIVVTAARSMAESAIVTLRAQLSGPFAQDARLALAQVAALASEEQPVPPPPAPAATSPAPRAARRKAAKREE